MNLGLDVVGDKRLAKQLDQVGKAVRRKAIRSALTFAARAVRTQARDIVPVRTGTLRRAIQTRIRTVRGSLEAHLFVTAGRRARYDGWYWHLVEFGAVGRSAHPFIRPAFDREEDNIVQAYRQRLNAVLREYR